MKGLFYPAEYFVERIHDVVKGLRAGDKKLTRVIIARGKIYMPQINNAYRRKFGRDMIGNSSGDSRKILVY